MAARSTRIQRRIIPADPALPVQEVIPTNGKKPTLEEAQAAVGGYVEPHRFRGRVVVYLNEEGRLRGLPPNLRAHEFLVSRDPRWIHTIPLGDALVIEGADW